MTTKTDGQTPDAALAGIDRALAALPDESVFQRKLDANRQQREALEARRLSIQRTTAMLADLEGTITTEEQWGAHLEAWRAMLCTELLAFPRRVSGVELGRRQNVELSIITIDRGLQPHGQWTLETLRLGALMREAGYVEGPKVDNQVHGPLPWFGSLPDVERRLADLRRQRDNWQRALDDALMDPDTLAQRNRGVAEAARAQGTLKTRGDGSTYRKFADGTTEEVSEAATS